MKTLFIGNWPLIVGGSMLALVAAVESPGKSVADQPSTPTQSVPAANGLWTADSDCEERLLRLEVVSLSNATRCSLRSAQYMRLSSESDIIKKNARRDAWMKMGDDIALWYANAKSASEDAKSCENAKTIEVLKVSLVSLRKYVAEADRLQVVCQRRSLVEVYQTEDKQTLDSVFVVKTSP